MGNGLGGHGLVTALGQAVRSGLESCIPLYGLGSLLFAALTFVQIFGNELRFHLLHVRR